MYVLNIKLWFLFQIKYAAILIIDHVFLSLGCVSSMNVMISYSKYQKENKTNTGQIHDK